MVDSSSGQPLLLLLARDRHNLVIDSACPELAPHIVVSPPEGDPWADYWASWFNRVDPQDSSFLTVPDRDYSFGFLPPVSDHDLASDAVNHGGSTPDGMLDSEDLYPEPQRVFNPSRFCQKVW